MDWRFWGKVAVIVVLVALAIWVFRPIRRRRTPTGVTGGGGSTSEPVTRTGDGSVSPKPRRPRAE